MQNTLSTTPHTKNNNKARILLLDDDPDITFTLSKGLQVSGFIVDVYNDSISVLSDFKPGVYNLLLLDVKLPQINGFELYREIVKIDTKVKVCFITAYEVYYEELKADFPKLSVGCYISKPIDIDRLAARIREELES